MKKTFEILISLIVLSVIGTVLWQITTNTPSPIELESIPAPAQLPPEPQPVACTMDAKECPDGSFIGRNGPDCEFAACPNSEFPIRYGEDASRIEEYRFDCGQKNGIFNECASACGPEAEVCMDVCSMVCTGPASEYLPPEESVAIECSPESKKVDLCTMDYTPVCGLVEVQCIKAPCDLVPQTFGNACGACSQGNVISYTEGECLQAM